MKLPWKTIKTNQKPWKTMKLPIQTMEINLKSWKTMKLPIQTMKTNKKPWKTMKVLIFRHVRGVTTDLHDTEWESAHFSSRTRGHNWPFRCLDYVKILAKDTWQLVKCIEILRIYILNLLVHLISTNCQTSSKLKAHDSLALLILSIFVQNI